MNGDITHGPNELIARTEAMIQLMSQKVHILDKSDIDELYLVCNSNPEVFHQRFFDVLETLDSHFDIEFPEHTERNLSRLARILSVARTLPDYGITQQSRIEPIFELEENDRERILELCTGMRKIVFSSELFDDPHRLRLLNRIAAIEKEVHQAQGKLDTILAGVVDVGEALGKFGEKVEPLTKRMKEIADIARGRSKEYDQIPPPEEPLGLPAPNEE